MRAEAGNVSELFVSFQGEGAHAGRRHLFVRLGGCPLRCRYCDEPESLVPVAECRILGPDGMRRRANPFSPDALDAEVTALAATAPPLHALAVTGGEPLAQADFLAAWLALRAGTLPVLLETAGILPGRLARVLPRVAIVSFDVKCPSNTGARALGRARGLLAHGRRRRPRGVREDAGRRGDGARGGGARGAAGRRGGAGG